MTRPAVGSIGWVDLTVPDAEATRDFYESVAGWSSQAVSMGDYHDYGMAPRSDAAPVAGICHARGINRGLPPVWLMYIVVADLEASLAASDRLGGTVLQRRAPDRQGTMAVIRDPAGAVCALFQPAD